ncbi:MAG: phosphoribosylamine--glycine ligase [Candidatus Omnitrophica bacterium CG11_big_fil_rev_8_21_14_0_20_64_10]|nr:MAG: phosphoribosylamine--glycine ligase [Candidatus Omnitrophica bacterium CG11_big_fil_rev_8_21_14_0_20_64_10]
MEKKKFLFASLDGLIGDIAWQVAKEGHAVKYGIDHASEKEIADGFVPKADDWRKEVDWADIVVFDDVLGQGTHARALRKQGKPVVGGTPYTDRLEDDRSFGQNELKNFGISVIPFEDFQSFDEAIRFIQKSPGRYVIKPSGEAQNIKRLLFVGEEEDGQDTIHVLESYKKVYANKVKQFQLQKRVAGVEVAVGAFFNGRQFVHPINVNFEHKKLFPGDIGPATGEMGTMMYWSKPNRIFNATLARMEGKLAGEGYVGYMDLNCMVNHQGIYPLEFTARFGYPTISIQQEGMLTPIGEFLWGLAHGETGEFKTRSGFQIGVRVVVPPYPFEDPKTFEVNSQERVIIFKKDNKDGLHIEDVKLVDGEWVVTGTAGVVLVAVGLGQTVKKAQEQAYGRIRNLMIPNMYYRTDIGDRWIEDADKLHTWGYLRDS